MIEIKTGMALAAGLGTRMRPLTDDRPKALVELGGKRLVDFALDRLAATGVQRGVVNVHHFADDMEAYLARRTGAPEIIISDERDALLETGGGVVKALPLLGEEPVFITNIDAVWLDAGASELDRMRAAWKSELMDVLLLLAPMGRTLGFDGAGDFFLEDDGRVAWRGDRPTAPYAYAGTQIHNPKIMAGRPQDRFSMTEVWRELVPAGRVHGLVMDSFWMHVGDPVARDAAEARLAR